MVLRRKPVAGGHIFLNGADNAQKKRAKAYYIRNPILSRHMFRRSFKLQPASPLRSSDRRKLRNSVIEHFLDPVSGVRFGDLLVPEGVRVAKFTTHDEAGVCGQVIIVEAH